MHKHYLLLHFKPQHKGWLRGIDSWSHLSVLLLGSVLACGVIMWHAALFAKAVVLQHSCFVTLLLIVTL